MILVPMTASCGTPFLLIHSSHYAIGWSLVAVLAFNRSLLFWFPRCNTWHVYDDQRPFIAVLVTRSRLSAIGAQNN